MPDSIIRVIEVVRDMLMQRGHDLSGTILQEKEIAKDIATHVSRNRLYEFEVGPDLKVNFNLNERHEKTELKAFVDRLQGTRKHIVICASLENKLRPIIDQMKNVEMFEVKELQYDPSKNELTPEHILIDDEQVIKDLVSTYRVKSKMHFPHILRTDRMARHLGAQSGNVIKVLRINPSSGESVAYRFVN
jgi:DNA-directed RNA polymerase subunit H (RpoH/RPB5)